MPVEIGQKILKEQSAHGRGVIQITNDTLYTRKLTTGVHASSSLQYSFYIGCSLVCRSMVGWCDHKDESYTNKEVDG